MRILQNIFLSLPLIIITFLLFGCAQPPKEEEKAAKDSLQVARDAEAPTYAQREWSDADQTYTSAEQKMENKEYEDAKKLLLSVKDKATVAKNTAENNKKLLTEQLTKSKESAQAAVTTIKAEFAKEQKRLAKTTAANIQAMIKEAEQSIEDANQSILSGNLNDAKEKIAAASAKADEATTNLQKAVTAKHKKHTTVNHTKSTAAKKTKAVVAKHKKKKGK